jgi:hypothetical protein
MMQCAAMQVFRTLEVFLKPQSEKELVNYSRLFACIRGTFFRYTIVTIRNLSAVIGRITLLRSQLAADDMRIGILFGGAHYKLRISL